MALRQPADLALRIMDLRAYARAKQAVDRAQREQDAAPWQREVVFDVIATLYERCKAEEAAEQNEEP